MAAYKFFLLQHLFRNCIFVLQLFGQVLCYTLNFCLCSYLIYCSLLTSFLWLIINLIDFSNFPIQVLNFMWLKFFLIWRYFRFWSLVIQYLNFVSAQAFMQCIVCFILSWTFILSNRQHQYEHNFVLISASVSYILDMF